MCIALAVSTAEAQTVYISELLVGNDRSLCDSFGDDPDWVELRNPTAAAIDVGGWALTDQPRLAPKLWTFPAGTIVPAQGYLLVFFLNKDPAHQKRKDGKELHTNFRLNVKGDELVLLTDKGVEVHRVRFGPQARDVSIGTPDRLEPFAPLKWPTPGLPNNAPKPATNCK